MIPYTKLIEMKAEALQYIICGAWSVGGVNLAIWTGFFPTPAELSKAAIIAIVSAAVGMLTRYVVVRVKRWAKDKIF